MKNEINEDFRKRMNTDGKWAKRTKRLNRREKNPRRKKSKKIKKERGVIKGDRKKER